MTDETTQPTDNQTSTTTEAVAAPAATETTQAAPPANPAVSETTEGNEQPKPARSPWYQTRIDQLTAARRAAEAEVVRLRAQLGQPAASPTPVAAAQQPAYSQQPANQNYQPGPALDEAEVQRRAAAIVQEQQFNNACNDLASKGKTAYPDFDASVANFNMLGGLGQHMGLLQGVTALENGHDVLYHLGKDLNQAMEVAALPPVQQGMALAKLSAQLRQGKAPSISGAPAPISPVNGLSTNTVPAPNDNGEFASQADFRRYREAQKAAKKARR